MSASAPRAARSQAPVWGALGLSALLLAPFVYTSHFHPDELIQLYEALRQARGQMIYRDFFEFITPLSQWLVAPLFWLLGPSLLAARLVLAILMLTSAALMAGIARQLGAGPWAAAGAALLLVPGLFRHFPAYFHHWVALPGVLAALWLAMRGLREDGRPWHWVLAGVMTALAGLTTQSDGVVLVAVLFGGLGLGALLGALPGREALRAGGWLAAGIAGPALAAIAYVAARGALGAAWYHTVVWPASHYKTAGSYNDIKFATDLSERLSPFTTAWVNLPHWYLKVYHLLTLEALFFGAAVVAAVWGLGLIERRLRHGERASRADLALGFLALTVVALFALCIRGRADVAHVALYAAPAVVLACVLAERGYHALARPEQLFLRWLPALALALFGLSGAVLSLAEMRRAPGLWLSATPPDTRLADSPVIRYIRAHTQPGDTIVSLPSGGADYFYGRDAATRTTFMLPPVFGYNTEDEWRALFDEIARTRPRLVIFTTNWGEAGLKKEFLRYPLPGYRRAAVLLLPETTVPVYAYIYSRQGADGP